MNYSAPHWPVHVPHLLLLNTGPSVGCTFSAPKGRPNTDQATEGLQKSKQLTQSRKGAKIRKTKVLSSLCDLCVLRALA